jgi:hypothetical protein
VNSDSCRRTTSDRLTTMRQRGGLLAQEWRCRLLSPSEARRLPLLQHSRSLRRACCHAPCNREAPAHPPRTHYPRRSTRRSFRNEMFPLVTGVYTEIEFCAPAGPDKASLSGEHGLTPRATAFSFRHFLALGALLVRQIDVKRIGIWEIIETRSLPTLTRNFTLITRTAPCLRQLP